MPDPSDRKQIRPQFVGGIPGHVVDAEYAYFDSHVEAGPLTIACGGWELCAPDFQLNRGSYPYWFVIYTLEGHGRVVVGDRSWPLHAGSLSGFAPGSPHRYDGDPAHPMEQIFATFEGPEAASLFAAAGLDIEPVQRVADAPACLGLFEQFLQTGLEQGRHAQAICGHLLQIVLLRQAENRAAPERPGAWQTYQTCRRYLHDHFTLLHGPAEAAEACDVDVRYLAALFKRFGTTSPSRYLLRLKLSHAADLLLTTSLPVKDVAARVGFADPYHFSRRFRQVHGCPPRAYRARHLSPDP